MAEVWREALKSRLNFEINFPRTGRKGIGKLRYQAGREPAPDRGRRGNFWKIGKIFETWR
jgi:hypothetical protein